MFLLCLGLCLRTHLLWAPVLGSHFLSFCKHCKSTDRVPRQIPKPCKPKDIWGCFFHRCRLHLAPFALESLYLIQKVTTAEVSGGRSAGKWHPSTEESSNPEPSCCLGDSVQNEGSVRALILSLEFIVDKLLQPFTKILDVMGTISPSHTYKHTHKHTVLLCATSTSLCASQLLLKKNIFRKSLHLIRIYLWQLVGGCSKVSSGCRGSVGSTCTPRIVAMLGGTIVTPSVFPEWKR